MVSVLTCLVGTGLAVAVNFATEDGAGVIPWVAVAVLTVLSAVLAIVLQPKQKPQPGHGGYPYAPPAYQPRMGYPAGQPAWRPPPARPRRTVSLAAAILVFALIVGGAGGVAYAGWYGVSWLTGNEAGQSVLVSEASATEGPLTLTVHEVEITRHFTKVELTAVNGGRDSIGLPLFGNCQLNAGGATLGTWMLGSDWQDTVPAGESVRGEILFGGRPAPGAATMTLSFANVYSLEVQSITVRDIRVRPS